MASQKQDELKAVLQAMAGQQVMRPHATPDELAAYHNDTLRADEKAQIREHLVWCRDCTAALLDFVAWEDAGTDHAPGTREHRADATWQNLQQRIHETDTLVGATLPSLSTSGTWFSRIGIPYAMAASLLVVSLGLGYWGWKQRRENAQLLAQLTEQGQGQTTIARQLQEAKQELDKALVRSQQQETEIAELRQDVDELLQPQLNTVIADLRPQEITREQGSNGSVTSVEIPSNGNVFTVILNMGEHPPYPDYGVEFLDQRGNEVWNKSGLRKIQQETLTVSLHRKWLPAGIYRVRLYGLRGGKRQLLENYQMRVQYK